MRNYDHIIIGFGKGGKTIAGALASKGDSVALIEQSDKMFGGTCINVACLPTKALEYRARLAKKLGADFAAKAEKYATAIKEKRELTSMLREKNLKKAVSAGVEVIVGKASFSDEHVIHIEFDDGQTEDIQGGQIYINTGAKPSIPDTPGLKESKYVYTSESLMELDKLPESLAVIGGGYIGLEFSSYYNNFGSKVTILQRSEAFIPKEDEEIAASVLESFEKRGIDVMRETKVVSIADSDNGAVLTIQDPSGIKELTVQAVLVAAGRKPNIDGLNLESAGVELTPKGAVKTDNTLRTSVPHIYAMGDVTGGQQFTYISLDDSRIVKSQILGDKSRTTDNRGEVPYSVFIDPPLSRTGLTEKQAIEKGYKVKVAKLAAAAIPKAQVIAQPVGLLKVIVDSETNLIIGAHLFCSEAHEMINIFKIAIDAKLPYTVLRDAIFTHPTMTEGLNDLLSTI